MVDYYIAVNKGFTRGHGPFLMGLGPYAVGHCLSLDKEFVEAVLQGFL
jgi:hypothetical protein